LCVRVRGRLPGIDIWGQSSTSARTPSSGLPTQRALPERGERGGIGGAGGKGGGTAGSEVRDSVIGGAGGERGQRNRRCGGGGGETKKTGTLRHKWILVITSLCP
jgi:hypothetical protein